MATIIASKNPKGLNVQCQLYKELLEDALSRFYKEDAEELFDDNPVDEWAMVGCIARYVWCGRQCDKYKELLQHVDVEYNKMGTSEKALIKAFDRVFECEGKCLDSRYKECGSLIQSRIDANCSCSPSCQKVDCSKHKYRFRPDLIVHKRGTRGADDGNGMVVEFKKDGANDGDIAFDCAKIRYCTCSHAEFRYKIGAFVLLKRDGADVQIFVDGQKSGDSFRVDGTKAGEWCCRAVDCTLPEHGCARSFKKVKRS